MTGQVEEHLLELAGVGLDGAGAAGSGSTVSSMSLADAGGAASSALSATTCVEVEDLRGSSTCLRPKASSWRVSSAARSPARLDLGEEAAIGVVRAEGVEQQAGVADDDGQQVVEVVRDPAGQPADGLHLLRLAELLLAGPQLAFGLGLVEGHGDGRAQLAILEWLEDVAERFGGAGPHQGGLVRVGGQVHHGDLEAAADLLGGGDAVHVPLQPDVHQDQVRAQLAGEPDGFLPPGRDAGQRMAQAKQAALDVHGHDGFVLDDEDPCLGHARKPPSCGSGVNTMVNLVPPVRSTWREPPSCWVNRQTSCKPSVGVRPGSSPSGRPTPSSRTVSA